MRYIAKHKKLLTALLSLQLATGIFAGGVQAAPDFIISGSDETDTTFAGHKAYGQDYFCKKNDEGTYVPDTEWKHEGAIIMGMSEVTGSQHKYIFDRLEEGFILPTYLDLNTMEDHWAPTMITGTGPSGLVPGRAGYEEMAAIIRKAIEEAPGETLQEKVVAFQKAGKVPPELKTGKMVMINIEQGDDKPHCYSDIRWGVTPVKPNYGNVKVGRLGVWQPMDWGDRTYYVDESGQLDANIAHKTMVRVMPNGRLMVMGNLNIPQKRKAQGGGPITEAILYTDSLEMAEGSKVNLSYLNTTGLNPRVNQYAYDKHARFQHGRLQDPTDSQLARDLVINKAVLDKDTVFRLGVYKRIDTAGSVSTGMDSGIRRSDGVWIREAEAKNKGEGPNMIYIELGYVPEMGEKVTGNITRSDSSGEVNEIFGILHGGENFEVEGRATRAEGIFSEYLVTPVIKKLNPFDDNNQYFLTKDGPQGRAWELNGYSYEIVGTSEGGKTAQDNAVVTNNLWKYGQRNLFKRTGGLNNLGNIGERKKENFWTEARHEKFTSASDYGRDVDQHLNTFQIGYDRLVRDNFRNGKIYAGLYADHTTGSSTTLTGGGDQKATGVGLYGTWKGDRGHYIDVALMYSRLDNDYHFLQDRGETKSRVKGDFNTNAYGIGTQYGYRKALKDGWYVEPQLTAFAGTVKGCDYELKSDDGRQQKLKQNDFNSITARAGLYVGKDFQGRGELYLGAFAGHDYTKDMEISVDYFNQYTNNLGETVTTSVRDKVDMHDTEDTWYELNLGGKYDITDDMNVYLNYRKTLGSSIGNTWMVNGGMQWQF